MRYSASEKLGTIRLVEQSHLPVRRALEKLNMPRTRFGTRSSGRGSASQTCLKGSWPSDSLTRTNTSFQRSQPTGSSRPTTSSPARHSSL